METAHNIKSRSFSNKAHELSHYLFFADQFRQFISLGHGSWHSATVERSSSTDALLNKLKELATLPKGWRFGEGIPTKPEVLIATLDLYYRIARYDLKADAFPWSNGSVSLVFYERDMCVEISIHERDIYDVVVEKGYGFEYDILNEIDNASFEDVNEAINKTMEPKWNLYESYMKGNITEQWGDSSRAALQIPAVEPEFLWSIWNASRRSEELHADISPTTTRMWPGNQLFIGTSPKESRPVTHG